MFSFSQGWRRHSIRYDLSTQQTEVNHYIRGRLLVKSIWNPALSHNVLSLGLNPNQDYEKTIKNTFKFLELVEVNESDKDLKIFLLWRVIYYWHQFVLFLLRFVTTKFEEFRKTQTNNVEGNSSVRFVVEIIYLIFRLDLFGY